jgi:HEAT repeat protein
MSQINEILKRLKTIKTISEIPWQEIAKISIEETEFLILQLINLFGEENNNSLTEEAIQQILLKFRELAVLPLIKALNSPLMEVRYRAAIMLGLLGDPRAIEPLIACFDDEEFDVGREAGISLKKIGEETLTRIMNVALFDNNARKRSFAVLALENFKGPLVEETIFKCLGDPDEWVCYRAVVASAKHGFTDAVEPLTKILIGETFQIPAIGQSSIRKMIKQEAAKTLGIIGSKKASKALIKTLFDKDVYLSEKAAEALGLIGDIPSIEPLIEALKTADIHSLRHYIVQALSRFGETARQPIKIALKNPDSNIRFGAAMVLGNVGDLTDINELERLIENDKGETFSHEKVGTAANKAIKRIKERSREHKLKG